VTLDRLGEAEQLARALPGPDGTTGDRLRLARVHSWMGRAHYYRSAVREAIGYYRQVLAVAQEIGDEELMALPSSVIGQALMLQGQYGKARPLVAQAIAPLERTASWPDWIRAVLFHGLAQAAQGEYYAGLAEAERGYARAVELNSTTMIATGRLIFWLIHYMGGNAPRMLEESRAVLHLAEQAGDRLYVYIGLAFRALAESWLGQHEAALESMAQSRAIAEDIGGRLLLHDFIAALNTEITFAAGQVDEALTLSAEARAVAQAVGSVVAEAIAMRVHGQALATRDPARWEEAEALLTAAQQLLEEGASYLEVARLQLAWGVLCRGRGDVAAARAHLDRAAARFQTSELPWEIERVQQALATLPDSARA
jgi:ATP/maltotriose-dependent transcriptional regulator MalT